MTQRFFTAAELRDDPARKFLHLQPEAEIRNVGGEEVLRTSFGAEKSEIRKLLQLRADSDDGNDELSAVDLRDSFIA